MGNACVNFEERRNCDAADGGGGCVTFLGNIIACVAFLIHVHLYQRKIVMAIMNCRVYIGRVYIGRVYMDHHTMTQILWCATTLPYFH